MIDLLNSLALAGASIGVVVMSAGLLWCWVNRSRLRNWKF